MTALTAAPGGYRATAASGIDRAIRLSAAAAVLAVAGIAAIGRALLRRYRGAGLRRVPSRSQPLRADSTTRATAIRSLRAGGRRVSLPGGRPPLPTREMVTELPKPLLTMM